MNSSGIIYDSALGITSGEIYIKTRISAPTFTLPSFSLPKISLPSIPKPSLSAITLPQPVWNNQILRSAVQGVGAGLIMLSVIGIGLTITPLVSSEISLRVGKISKTLDKADAAKAADAQAKLNRAAEIESKQKAYATQLASELGITNTDFSIYIPAIDAKSDVLAGIDPSDEEAYRQALMQGVAQAKGSSLPGMSGATFIFSHSTNAPFNIARYNAVFYALKDINPENHDDIYIFYKDKVYRYKIAEKQIVEPDDVSWLTNAGTGPERLILQTCWPPGTSWKRLIVVAYPDHNLPYSGFGTLLSN